MNKTHKTFFLLKTTKELMEAEEKKQLVLTPVVKESLKQEPFKLNSLVAAKVTKDSPGEVSEVTLVDSPEIFLKFAF